MPVTTVLVLVGSPTSLFYQQLSELYARGAVDALAPTRTYAFRIAHVDPAGAWRFPASLAPAAIAAADPVDLPAAIERIASIDADIALPQMFCQRGVSDYRALLDLLGLPYLGNPPLQMAIAADKAMARAIVAAAGVAVPAAQLLRRGDAATLALPVVVKPNTADNSDGVSLVTAPDGLPAALAGAFAHADAVLVETFVPLGREVRCGVVERGGVLRCLPLEEYRVDAVDRPIRTRDAKLRRDEGGALHLAAKTAEESWIVAADDAIGPAVEAAALAAYRALGLRQYGLFDFRVDPQGRPWFLEAGPYCSFAPDSVVVTMMAAAGTDLPHFFAAAVADVLADAAPATTP